LKDAASIQSVLMTKQSIKKNRR